MFTCIPIIVSFDWLEKLFIALYFMFFVSLMCDVPNVLYNVL